MRSTIHLTDGQVYTSTQACIYDPSEHSQCGEYRLTDDAKQWCAEANVTVVVDHWPDNSCALHFASDAERLMFCLRWNLGWALFQ